MESERILHILNYLTRSTNETKSVTVREILDHLAANFDLQNVSALTVRRDIDRLITAGYDIRITHGAHNTAYYALWGRGFSFNEIRFLVDSVSINQFLSEKQKKQLIRKFEVFCSEEELRKLVSRVVIAGQVAPSTDLLRNLEQVHSLIAAKQKINFEYGKYDTGRQMQFYSKKREMIPVRVVYFDGRFYLRCVNEETGAERTYRIDRMRDIREGGKAKRAAKLSHPDGVQLDMFQPERYAAVTFRADRVLLDDMLEHFGKYADVQPDDDPQRVRIRVRIGIGPSFYRWVMGYGSQLEVLAPADIRSEMQRCIRQTLALYDDEGGQ